MAGSRDAAEVRANDLQLGRTEWRYISSARDIFGYRGPDLRLELGFESWVVRDLPEILAYARTHDIAVPER